jgi:ribulose 1,5-bisphosphate synthetase/thiazole synthase
MSEYTGFRIKAIHAIVAVSDDDEEGVCGFETARGPMPLIAADPKRLEIITAMAQAVADATGKDFEIVRFTVREHIGDIKAKAERRVATRIRMVVDGTADIEDYNV